MRTDEEVEGHLKRESQRPPERFVCRSVQEARIGLVEKGALVSANNLPPYRNTRDDQVFQFLGLPTLVRATSAATNGAFGLIEQPNVPPGFASPYHVHHREDESFYVLQGQVAFVCDGKWLTAGPGDFVFGPKHIPHGFRVTGTAPAHMLLLVTPGGFEQFTKDLSEPASTPPSPPDIAKLVAVAATYGVDILGPLPER
jgi:mannose-6-phosphate isomerase-like protein (cupin superfamily)